MRAFAIFLMTPCMDALFIGLMSGTSMDGVDGVLVRFVDQKDSLSLVVLAHAHQAFSPEIAAEFLSLNESGMDELHRAALAGNSLARTYASVVQDLLDSADVPACRVVAIGAHGQTVRHRPGEFDGTGYTVQVNNGALLAELTGIDVIADFRSRDVAAGGQGAPLVPGFHRAFLACDNRTTAVLNIGGISNLSVLHADGETLGFDCGPGNVLMNLWCQAHTGDAYDHDGNWAASGTPDSALMRRMLNDPYFQRHPPKSTGRDLFNMQWLLHYLHAAPGESANRPQDVQATLADLTAKCCAQALIDYAPDAATLLVCGGGAFNRHLMRRLTQHLPKVNVASTLTKGLPADQVEATAFAWLAQACVNRRAGSIPAVTGAAGARVLGAIYPASG